MKTIETGIPGLLIIEPNVHGDSRGFFMETWNADRYEGAGLPAKFVQSNLSRSGAGVIRGLHYQYPEPQAKLISVLEGRVFDVAVDIRPDSPTFRQWVGVELSAENHRQFFVPEGFAHGFCVLGESALLSYLCTAVYRAEYDAVVAWDDPDIAVRWPLKNGRLSQKDAAAPRLRDISDDALPGMQP
ncbi:MAG: dTDP-4-dehydrorhamnose 3,5-epimerase [Xanthomonadales bacterium]|nr:dTDP-4-dehydrorhamnose 3,5-epimerase [Gammaproteobacteria bacterium]MBT8054671.1 dTDP-4-dehydrorhamnose 3,5-epimerase [Gammaproteobacteria bacterium]NND55761.1 dTDP-4-dehydrorhamnose 3,5-epimerase [Xanthomonadales bacterium]NNK50172.1 dTDP-4-dehydrorhamnose 3,5-epimerase [Xanthomonadales bacterium]